MMITVLMNSAEQYAEIGAANNNMIALVVNAGIISSGNMNAGSARLCSEK
jgi:hypothetical protein